MQCNMLGSNRFFRKKYDNDVGERDSPLQVQLIKFLGLKNYFMNNFIFRRKPSSNRILIQNTNSSSTITKIASCARKYIGLLVSSQHRYNFYNPAPTQSLYFY